MKRSEAAKYARWSAAAAALLASVTAGVYLSRKWQAHQEIRRAPPPTPQDVQRLSSGLTFSKGVGTQKIFTVEASKATDFKDRNASLLEEVKITIFGKTGDRHDVIHTQSCQYEKEGGNIACSGEVKLEFESKAEFEKAEKNPHGKPVQKIYAETRGVVFNRASGLAQSDQPVKFDFPSGNGKAVGVEYKSEEGQVRLLKDVELFLKPQKKDKEGKAVEQVAEPVRVTARSLDFERDSRTMLLYGPVEAVAKAEKLHAGKVKLDLDAAFKAEKMVATDGGSGKNPEMESQGADGTTKMSAQTMTARLAPEGWLMEVEGAGDMQGERQTALEKQEFQAENGVLELKPRVNQPKTMNLKGSVQLRSHANSSEEARLLQTSALRMEFAERKKGEGSKLSRAETLAAGTMEWTDALAPSGKPGGNSNVAPDASRETGRTKLKADKLEMEFGDEGKARKLIAAGNVTTERMMSGKPTQTATADYGVAQLLTSGGWSQMDLQGNVKLREADRSGKSEHATFVRATQAAVLTGKAVARDATTETQAPRITFLQNTGEIHAEGGVRSTDFSNKGSGGQASLQTNITAEEMTGNSKSGSALYTGHARLWQGDSVMDADSIELLREAQVMNASGNVRAVFPQTASQAMTGTPGPGTTKKAQLWHVTAGTLTYSDKESRAHLEKNVVAISAEQKMRAPVVDLFFTRGGKPEEKAASAPQTAANGTLAAKQISRAVGTGGVTVDQGTRKATAERGEYNAVDGKFVMSGGTPTIYDAAEGTTTGRQLTFFLADDTIIVDSENGSRTLTKHRVEH